MADSVITRTTKPDPLSPSARSACMRAVKSVNTSPELRLRKILHQFGYRYRLHQKNLPGKPDITLAKHKTVIFVHGCFWHGHHCPKGLKRPSVNAEFWDQKIAGNQLRDAKNQLALQAANLKVAVIFECELKKSLKQDSTGAELVKFIFSQNPERVKRLNDA